MKLLRMIRRLILLLIVFGFIGLSIYTYFYSPNDYQFKTYTYVNSSINSKLNGLKIAYISDINLSDKKSMERFQKIIKELNENPFDMIFFGGDLYNDSIFDGKTVSETLKSIDCKYGKFAILGEKDTSSSVEITQILNNGGFEVLNNEMRTLYYQDTSLTLIACDEKTDISQFETPEKSISICLTHQPDSFSNHKNKINLQLSGHSYGGSFYIPYYGSLNPNEGAKTYNHGRYDEGNSSLIVSNGFHGPASFPYKLFSRNEVNFIILKTSSNT